MTTDKPITPADLLWDDIAKLPMSDRERRLFEALAKRRAARSVAGEGDPTPATKNGL